jgi:beta-carotene 3-hydroxylase
MSPLLLAIGAFAVMELVSYAAHRWVMHGFAMAWHRSHHLPARGRVERNDLFPLTFSSVGVLLFALGAGGWPAFWWVGVGVTAYGACYLFVHEVYIHHRLPVPVPRWRYLEWLRSSHRAHHLTNGEPFGMLLPLVRSQARDRPLIKDPLDRSVPR